MPSASAWPPREDPLLVLRRSQEAGNDQLPHLQAGARRPVLRQDLRPIKDYECLCGKYKRLKHRGVICEKCGVEVTQTKVRRERMGHIDLAAPCAHLVPEVAAVAPGPGARHDAARHRARAVLRSLRGDRPRHDPAEEVLIMSEDDYDAKRKEYGDEFIAKMGAEGIKDLLEGIDLDIEIEKLRGDLTGSSQGQEERQAPEGAGSLQEVRHQAPVDGDGRAAGAAAGPASAGAAGRRPLRDLRPERPVSPRHQPQLAPARLLELKAPEIIARNEKRMLQEAVDSCWTTAVAARR